MRRYFTTTIGGLAHLGTPDYEDDIGFTPPTTTLCGIQSATWSRNLVRPAAWSKRKPGSVCASCDRTALWQAVMANRIN